VPTDSGHTGIISLILLEPASEIKYDPSTGQIIAEFKSSLHYELIDKIKGYRQIEGTFESDVFLSYKEEMTGKLVGKLPVNLQITNKDNVSFEGELSLEIHKKVLGAIHRIVIFNLRIQLSWMHCSF
jgi:hypothetical protein